MAFLLLPFIVAATALTLIRDASGNIFGGVAGGSWESPQFGKQKSDEEALGCLFMLKNSHGLQWQTFKQIRERRRSWRPVIWLSAPRGCSGRLTRTRALHGLNRSR
jgi:hypothetical protein